MCISIITTTEKESEKLIVMEVGVTCCHLFGNSLVTVMYILIGKTVFVPLTAVFKLQLMSSDRLGSFSTVLHRFPPQTKPCHIV